MYHEQDYSSNNDRVQGAGIYQRRDHLGKCGIGNLTLQWHIAMDAAYGRFVGVCSPNSLLIGLYGISANGNDIHIDDIALGNPTCRTISGGLVAGLVSDANSGTGLVGVNLNSDTGASNNQYRHPAGYQPARWVVLVFPVHPARKPPGDGSANQLLQPESKRYRGE